MFLKQRVVQHKKVEEERAVTCEDIRLIMPTVLILVLTLLVIATVIPYAFSTAIGQLRALQAREAAEAAEKTIMGNLNLTSFNNSLTPIAPTSTEISEISLQNTEIAETSTMQ